MASQYTLKTVATGTNLSRFVQSTKRLCDEFPDAYSSTSKRRAVQFAKASVAAHGPIQVWEDYACGDRLVAVVLADGTAVDAAQLVAGSAANQGKVVLQQLLAEGTILRDEAGEYTGKASDGQWVGLGSDRNIDTLHRYLADRPRPDQW
jgi:hypothetical protein